ncbi:hypothetical protein FQN54_002055 [Arachnomyces sp. PD_36]|nr:hypothetical protein FQN54_002055 [Arachnomyces sp. PD_36]
MRPSSIPSVALSILTLFSKLQPTQAVPFELDGLLPRASCDNPCGYYGQVCCESNQECYTTDNNEAACRAPVGGDGGWEYWTTTITQTGLVTITSTGSSQIAGPTGDGGCDITIGESPCGGVCCNAGQSCNKQGVCDQDGSSTFPTEAPTGVPPVRPTSQTEVTVTATATVPFLPPVGTDGSTVVGVEASTGGGLSGGAIAGIVIGVIAGVIFLLLLCACCCFKGALDGLWALLGLGRRRRRTDTYEEEHHHHHSSGGGFFGKWFGSKSDSSSSSSSDSSNGHSWFSWAGIGLLIGAIALCLGLKRRRDHQDDEKSSYYYSEGSTMYGYYPSEYTSSSM